MKTSSLGNTPRHSHHVTLTSARMSTEQAWDDAARGDLRESLQWAIVGELRLLKRDRDEILQMCREVYIDDECPESERDAFVHFAADYLRAAEAQLESEMLTWPDETDCDRLDRVERALRERGILLWQASPCCDTCTGGELPQRIDVINNRFPGFKDQVRGYTFFIDQNVPDALAEGPELHVYLGYGWLPADDAPMTDEEYQSKALAIAREVCECLRDEQFEPDWNGDISRKIGINLTWQRRTFLELRPSEPETMVSPSPDPAASCPWLLIRREAGRGFALQARSSWRSNSTGDVRRSAGADD